MQLKQVSCMVDLQSGHFFCDACGASYRSQASMSARLVADCKACSRGWAAYAVHNSIMMWLQLQLHELKA